jgi:hypothetical protein
VEATIFIDAIDKIKWRPRRLSPGAITTDRKFQAREVGLSEERVNRYASDMRRGDGFPEIKVARVSGGLYVVDGFHRVEAAKAAGLTSLAALVAPMNEKMAIRVAIAGNAKHGLSLTGKDKRRCFRLYCESDGHLRPDGSIKSLRQIRDDLGNIAWPNTISSWLRKAGIPSDDPFGPNVLWAEDEELGPDFEEFEIALHKLEHIFHQLNDDVRVAATTRMAEVAGRLVADERASPNSLDI